MNYPSDNRLVDFSRRLPAVAAAAMLLLAASTLAGWWFDLEPLRALMPGHVSMNPWTALCLVAAALSLLLSIEPRRWPFATHLATWLAAFVTLFAVSKLAGIATGRDLALDRTLFRALLDADSGLPPNRMAPNTALGFLLLGASILMVNRRSGALMAQRLALGLLLLSFIAILGYVYGVRAFYGVHTYIPMALNTAIAFALGATGAFLLRPDTGWAARLLASDSGGRMMRWILPVAVSVLGFLGWVVLAGERARVVDVPLGMSAMVATSVIVLGVVISVLAVSLGRTEAERNRAAEELRVAHAELETRVARRTAELAASNRKLRNEVVRRRQIEETLVKVTRAVEQTADLVAMTDREGRFEYVNPAFERHTGYSLEDLRNKTPRMLGSGEQDAAFYEELWRTILSGRVFHGVFINRMKSGEIYHEQKTISPIRDAVGQITHFVSTGADVTDRVKLEQQLRQAQKMDAVGRLAGGIAHDFNNLLTAILGFGSLAMEEAAEGSPLRAKLGQILKAGERAATLTRQLLAFSRQQVMRPTVLDLNQVVSEMDKLLRRLIGAEIDLRTELHADLGRIRADAGQLEQVLMNLVVNARDAMPQGGKLTIETASTRVDASEVGRRSPLPAGTYAALIVTDTGVGMEPAILSQIFDPFFTTKEKGSGTGLGLSIAHGIVQQSRGHIEVYSEAGRGTSFKVLLPIVEDDPLQAEPAADLRERSLAGDESVLLIEDDELVRALAFEALKSHGYRVLVAGNGDEAVAHGASDAPIDLLVSDVMLPGPSGPEVCATILERRPGTPVLFISGYTDRALHHRGALGPETPYLQKPFTAVALLDRVRTLLDGRGEAAGRRAA